MSNPQKTAGLKLRVKPHQTLTLRDGTQITNCHGSVAATIIIFNPTRISNKENENEAEQSDTESGK